MTRIPVQRKPSGTPWWVWLLIALVLAALLWFLFDLFINDRDEANDLNVDVPAASLGPVARDTATSPAASAGTEGVAASAAGASGNVTIAELAANPAAYLGQTVTVRGPIEEVITPSSFSLDEDAAFGGGIDNDVLVIGAQQAMPGLEEQSAGTEVEVTGVVRQVNVPALEQELGFDLDDALFRNHTFRPAIVAQSIQVLGGGGAATGNPAAGGSPGTTDPAAPPTGETVFDILTVLSAADRTQFAGRSVQFPGVYVQSVPSDKVFFAGPAPDNALPVLLDEQRTPNLLIEGRVNVNPGQSVTIIGTLRPLPVTDDVRQLVTLTPGDEAALSGQQVVVVAQQVIVENR